MTKEERWVLEEKYHGDTGAPGFAEDRQRLACGEPLAYVIGWQPFLGLRISLDSRPLIPRPETEWWTEQCLREASSSSPEAKRADTSGTLETGTRPSSRLLSVSRKGAFEKGASQSDEPRGGAEELHGLSKKYAAPLEGVSDARRPLASSLKSTPESVFTATDRLWPEGAKKPIPACGQPFTFLDLCAGSGAIGCAALAQLPHAQVFFGELDPAHESTIRGNIRGNGLDTARVDIRIGDLFTPFGDLCFDRIAANPPYIPEGRALPESVARHEPAEALYAGTDGLDLIRRIITELPVRLAPLGCAWIELDHALAEAARSLAREAGLSGTILNDQYGIPRVLVVSFS